MNEELREERALAGRIRCRASCAHTTKRVQQPRNVISLQRIGCIIPLLLRWELTQMLLTNQRLAYFGNFRHSVTVRVSPSSQNSRAGKCDTDLH